MDLGFDVWSRGVVAASAVVAAGYGDVLRPLDASAQRDETAGSIAHVDWEFDGEVIVWRGPAPYVFVEMPELASADLKEEARELIYWGQVPVRAVVGRTEFATALFPKDGRYLVPLRVAIRRAEGIEEGDVVTVRLRPERKTRGAARPFDRMPPR